MDNLALEQQALRYYEIAESLVQQQRRVNQSLETRRRKGTA